MLVAPRGGVLPAVATWALLARRGPGCLDALARDA